MSKKTQKYEPPAGALPNPEVDSCDHVDDDNDGICDSCGVEVEVETTSDDDKTEIDPPPSTAHATAPEPYIAPKQYYVKSNVGCPYYNGKSYKAGDVMPLTEADAPRWTKFVEYR